jgi:hypothetical protein
MEKKNNGHKKKQQQLYPQLKMDFYASIIVLDADETTKIFEIKRTSVDHAIAELKSLNDVKLRQIRRENHSQLSEQAKIAKDLMHGS